MFTREPSLTELTASPDEILSLQISLNMPMVALEDYPTDEGEATICSVRRQSDMVSTYVYLCLRGNETGVFYRYEADPYPEDLRDMVEGEALSFAESLGFIMDNTNFADLDAGERKQYLDRGPFGRGAAGSGVEAGGERKAPSPIISKETELSDAELGVAVPMESADFERAIQEFIGEDEDEPKPVGKARVPSEHAGATRPPLSRFKRRPSDADIYAIRGVATQAAPEADQSDEPPAPVAAQPVTEKASTSVERGEGDPETRARRARARYLASF